MTMEVHSIKDFIWKLQTKLGISLSLKIHEIIDVYYERKHFLKLLDSYYELIKILPYRLIFQISSLIFWITSWITLILHMFGNF